MRQLNSSFIHNSRGASLIEVMVSVFIFAVGVLGFASLQSRAVQATFDNGQRDQVIWLTQSLVDRVRSNSSHAAITSYTTKLSDFDAAGCARPARICDAGLPDCSATEMALFDVWDLYCRNTFQGANAIKALSVNLACSDGNCNTDVENIYLTTTWCARGVERTIGSASATCENTVAEMKYSIGFTP